MPLLDHFHPPLSEYRFWKSFYVAWACSIADDLNRRLPHGYFAEVYCNFCAEMDLTDWDPTTEPSPMVVAPLGQTSFPPEPARTIAAAFSDDVEIKVISRRNGPRLVAAIELVSPRNKDRTDARQTFAIKCVSHLNQGVSLIVVDIVTGRQANLHHEIMALLSVGPPLVPEAALYAIAHRPYRRDGQDRIDLWATQLDVGAPLPVLPLAISADVFLPIDLEAAYMDARSRRRL